MIELLKYRILWLKRIVFSLISFFILHALIINVSANSINLGQDHHTITLETYAYEEVGSSACMEADCNGRLSRVLSVKEVRPGHEVLAEITSLAAKQSTRVVNLADDIAEWLGKGARTIVNKNGDLVFISKNGTRRVRFDIKNPKPHKNPHSHVEELINGKCQKSGPLYPKDVPHF